MDRGVGTTAGEDASVRAGAMAAAAGAMVGWGLGPVMVKFIDLPELALTFHRLWIGALVGVAIMLAKGQRLTLRKLLISTPGGIAFGLDIAFFFAAVKHTTVADATVISALQPVLVYVVVGRLFGERVRPGDLAWTMVAIAGVGLVVFGPSHVAGRSLSGDALAVAALIAWTWYFIASKRAREQLSAFEYQAGLGIVAFIVIVPIALVSGQSLAVPNGSTWLWVLAMVAVPGGAHLLMNWAHAYVPLTVSSLLTLTTPIIAAVGAAVFLNEPLLAIQALGIAIVIAGLAVVVRRRTGNSNTVSA